MSFQLSGTTQTVPLPNILQIIQLASVSGVLSVRRDSIEKCIYFKGGEIVFATSNDSDDRLGDMLVTAGYVTRPNLEIALDEFKKTGGHKKIGAILVEKKFISPKNLFAGLKAQVKEIIYSLFLWDEAEYRFEERIAPDIIELQFSLQELIAEIIHRIKAQA